MYFRGVIKIQKHTPMTDILLNNDDSSIEAENIKGKEMIKIYPYCAIQALDSSYRVVRLNVVSRRFEVLPGIYIELDNCEEEVKTLNEESGPVEFILEDEA